MQLIKKWATRFVGQDCALCGESSPSQLICMKCERSLPRAASPGAGLAVFEYRFPVDRMVQRFKFAGDLAMGRWLALQLAARVAGEPRPDLIVSPPLTGQALRARGFNQALEVAKVVARRHRTACAIQGIERVRETPAQHRLGRRARRENLREAFRCDLDLDGQRVAIVDDVLTTGATAETLGRVLREAGATQVDVWTIARTPAPGERA